MSTATETLSESRRERMLRAMTELCAERGYEETTVDQIIRRAAVSEEDFGSMFADKESCAVAAENSILSDVVAAVSTSYSADRPEMDSVILGVKAILELMARKPSYAYFGYIVARQMAPEAVSSIYDTGYRLLVAMLERGWDYSELRDNPTYAALGALGGAEAVVRREVAAGRAGYLPRLLPDLVYAAAVPFLGQTEALRLTRRARELLRGSVWG